jgi:hypothetical protein
MRASDDLLRHLLPFWGLPVDVVWTIDAIAGVAPPRASAPDGSEALDDTSPSGDVADDHAPSRLVPLTPSAFVPIAPAGDAAIAPRMPPPRPASTDQSDDAGAIHAVSAPTTAQGVVPIASGGGGAAGIVQGRPGGPPASHEIRDAAGDTMLDEFVAGALPRGIHLDLRLDQVIDIDQDVAMSLALGATSAAGALLARDLAPRIAIDDDAIADQAVMVEIVGYAGPVDVRVIVDQRVDVAQDCGAAFTFVPSEGVQLDLAQLLRVTQHMTIGIRLAEVDGVLEVDLALGEVTTIEQTTRVEFADALDGLALSLGQFVDVEQSGAIDVAIEAALADRYAIDIVAELRQAVAVDQLARATDLDGDGALDLSQSVELADEVALRISFSGV